MNRKRFKPMTKCTLRLWFYLSVVFLISACGGQSHGGDEPPIPNEPYVPPVVHVYSNDSDSAGKVVEVKSNGTVIIDIQGKEIPKVGEIIASDVSKEAPQGFLDRVESVTTKNGKCELKTTPACINEVVKNWKINTEIPLMVDSIEDIHGNKVPFVQKKGQDVSFKLDIERNLSDEKDKKKCFEFKIKLNTELKLRLIADIENWSVNEFGGGFEGKYCAKIEDGLEFKTKDYKYENEIAKIKCKPIRIMAGYIPIVITPKIVPSFRVNANGKFKIALSLPIIESKCGYEAKYTREPDPNTGRNFRAYSLYSKDDLNPFKKFADFSLTILR